MDDDLVRIHKNVLLTHTGHRGIGEDEIKSKYNVDLSTPEVDGTVLISFNVIEKLAEEINISSALFFLNKPNDFARIPITDNRSRSTGKYSDKILRAIDHAMEYLKYYLELENPSELSLRRCELSDDPLVIAHEISDFLGFEKMRKSSPSDLLRSLKARMDEIGVLVFTELFSIDETRGFSVYHNRAPIIVLCVNEVPAARVFTLLHEFAHLLLKVGGISDSSNVISTNTIEEWCDYFAGEIYYPVERMKSIEFVGEAPYEEIRSIAKELKGSVGGTAFNLTRAGIISWSLYYDLFPKYNFAKDPAAAKDDSSGGGMWARTVVSRKGKKFSRAITRAWREERIPLEETLRVLNIKAKHLEEIEIVASGNI